MLLSVSFVRTRQHKCIGSFTSYVLQEHAVLRRLYACISIHTPCRNGSVYFSSYSALLSLLCFDFTPFSTLIRPYHGSQLA